MDMASSLCLPPKYSHSSQWAAFMWARTCTTVCATCLSVCSQPLGTQQMQGYQVQPVHHAKELSATHFLTVFVILCGVKVKKAFMEQETSLVSRHVSYIKRAARVQTLKYWHAFLNNNPLIFILKIFFPPSFKLQTGQSPITICSPGSRECLLLPTLRQGKQYGHRKSTITQHVIVQVSSIYKPSWGCNVS